MIKEHIESALVEYVDLFDKIGKEKLTSRYETQLTIAADFIEKMGYQDIVRIDELTLFYATFDYFSDILRLKSYHGIECIAEEKRVAYETYWLLRRKPFQKIKSGEDGVYVNEQFAVSNILHYLNDNCLDHNGVDLILTLPTMQFFTETLFYYFKYRQLNAQMIEMVILSFKAGRVYSDELQKAH
jgi:hypothetical protein